MTRLNPDRSGMPMHVDGTPWQHLPQMAVCLTSEYAGISAGLRLLELVHEHYAEAKRDEDVTAYIAHSRAAVAGSILRHEIAGCV